MNAVIREFTMNERSGLSVTALTGRAYSNDSVICVPSLKLNTPHSEIDLSAHTYWELVNIPTTGRLSARLNAYLPAVCPKASKKPIHSARSSSVPVRMAI